MYELQYLRNDSINMLNVLISINFVRIFVTRQIFQKLSRVLVAFHSSCLFVVIKSFTISLVLKKVAKKWIYQGSSSIKRW